MDAAWFNRQKLPRSGQGTTRLHHTRLIDLIEILKHGGHSMSCLPSLTIGLSRKSTGLGEVHPPVVADQFICIKADFVHSMLSCCVQTTRMRLRM
jgi:hypothetical protein